MKHRNPIRPPKGLISSTAFCTMVVLASPLWAANPLPVVNAGFEQPAVVNEGSTGPAPTGWSPSEGATVNVLNPSPSDLSAKAPEGFNVAIVTSSALETGLSQTLASPMQADANYLLRVKVANILFTTGFPGYRVQLVADGTVLAEDDNSQAIAEDTVVTSTVNYTYNAGLHAGLVGKPLQIRLLSKGLVAGQEVAFDDVTLSVTLASPIADSGGPYTVPFGGSLSLNGSGSLPSDGQTITTHEWDLDNDGDFDEGIAGASPATINYATLTAAPPAGFGMIEGINTIKLQVTDSAAKTSTVQTTVTLLPFVAASLNVDFQATIASEQHPTYAGEARFFHVSVNPANPGTGSYAATIVGTNNPAPPFVRNFDGPVVAYKFAGGVNNDINAVAQQGGTLGGSIITFTTTDTTFDGFGQQQAKLWTSTDPGPDLKISGSNPYNVAANTNATGGWRSLSDATGKIDITSIAAGSVHIYYGAFSAKPSVSVVMRDTDTGQPDITIANAHLNDDTADRTEYYLAEIDFVSGGLYDEIEVVWNAGAGGNGRGIAVVVTEAAPADPDAPTLDAANITDNSGGEPVSSVTPLAYTVAYSELMDPATISADDFELIGTASATITSVAHFGSVTTVNVLPTFGTSGTIQLQVKAGAVMTDLAGNPLDTTSAITDPDTVTVGDVIAPTVVSITSPSVSGTIYGTPTLTYTVTFSEFINPVDAGNFTNGGTAPFTIGAVTRISPAAPAPSVFTVEVIPSGSGTVQLEIQGAVQDPSGNALTVPATDTKVFTLDTGTEPARETVTLDAFTTSNLTANPHNLVFDASASDKLVVIVTGENGNPGSLAGKVNSLTYDGVAMTKAVGRFPIGSAPSATFDQTYNDIWYLDNPAAATALADENDPDLETPGNIRASVDSRGVITAIRLSGTAPGVGATAISAQEVKSVSVLAATSGGMVLASYGMGGDGNTANVGSVNTNPVEAELSAVLQGNSWNGHVTSRTSVASPGFVTAIFTGGNTIGTHTIAAEFLGALVGGGNPYGTWAAGFPGLTNNAPDLDFDGGGLATGIEWVVGGDPSNSADDAGFAPDFDTTTDPEFFIFTHRRTAAAAADAKTAIQVEYGSALAGWTTAVAGEDVIIDVTPGGFGPGVDRIDVKIRRTLALDDRLFARLKVAIAP